ncbi:MAG: hypothetical protein KC505_11515, partial [Myxococcales bacterium]|nr:hypothetical protein [Myxococcales bacterium]
KNPQAQYLLGTYYMTQVSNKYSRMKTKFWFQKALENNYAPAGYSLGLYLLKQGPKKNKQAIEILLVSAKLDCPFSQYLLGTLDSSYSSLQEQAQKQGIDWEAYIRHEDYILHMNSVFLEKE